MGSHLCTSNGYGVFKDSPEHRWVTSRCGQRPGVSVVAQETQSTWQQRGQREGGCQIHRDPWVVGEKLEFLFLLLLLTSTSSSPDGTCSSLPGEDKFFKPDTMAEKLVLSLSSSWGEFQ